MAEEEIENLCLKKKKLLPVSVSALRKPSSLARIHARQTPASCTPHHNYWNPV
jgi:hypothetical protein